MIDQDSDIKIVENFFPTIIFKEIVSKVENSDMKWGYVSKNPTKNSEYSTFQAQQKQSNIIEDISLFQYKFQGEDITAPDLRLIDLFRSFIENQFSTNVTKILRINCNIVTPYVCLADNQYTLPHVDIIHPHKSLIYYLNDTDGDTIFFNEFYKEKESEQLKIIKRIKPRKNLCVTFDGLRLHAMRPSTSNLRKIINVNYL